MFNISLNVLLLFAAINVYASCKDVDNKYQYTLSVVEESARVTQEKGKLLRTESKNINNVIKSDETMISESPYSDNCYFDKNDKSLTLIYGFDKHGLTVDHKATLEHFIPLLNEASSIVIDGHADAKGKKKYNLALSSRRAKSVSEYLRKKLSKNVQVSINAFGESQPTCSSEINKRNGCNRRVTISLANSQ